jgi:hypothetical protein
MELSTELETVASIFLWMFYKLIRLLFRLQWQMRATHQM